MNKWLTRLFLLIGIVSLSACKPVEEQPSFEPFRLPGELDGIISESRNLESVVPLSDTEIVFAMETGTYYVYDMEGETYQTYEASDVLPEDAKTLLVPYLGLVAEQEDSVALFDAAFDIVLEQSITGDVHRMVRSDGYLIITTIQPNAQIDIMVLNDDFELLDSHTDIDLVDMVYFNDELHHIRTEGKIYEFVDGMYQEAYSTSEEDIPFVLYVGDTFVLMYMDLFEDHRIVTPTGTITLTDGQTLQNDGYPNADFILITEELSSSGDAITATTYDGDGNLLHQFDIEGATQYHIRDASYVEVSMDNYDIRLYQPDGTHILTIPAFDTIEMSMIDQLNDDAYLIYTQGQLYLYEAQEMKEVYRYRGYEYEDDTVMILFEDDDTLYLYQDDNEIVVIYNEDINQYIDMIYDLTITDEYILTSMFYEYYVFYSHSGDYLHSGSLIHRTRVDNMTSLLIEDVTGAYLIINLSNRDNF